LTIATLVLGGVGVAVAVEITQTTRKLAHTTRGTTIAIPTQTATVPSVTEPAVTIPTPTPSYQHAIAYTTVRPPFTAVREVDVATAAQLLSAIVNLQPGDYVRNVAAGGFTVSGETQIDTRLAAPAVLDLGTGLSTVRFDYSGGANLPAVWLNNASNLRIYGGDITTDRTGGNCLLDYGSQHVTWWGFKVHDCGGSGFAAFTVGGPVDGDDFQGEISDAGFRTDRDPHTEKGTGLHGAILWDSSSSFAFTGNRFAFDVHDQPAGGAVEVGDDGTVIDGSANTLILRATNLTDHAVSQTGGSALELWGASGLGLHVPYLEAAHIQGRAVDTQGVADHTAGMAGVTVDYARATDTNLNSQLNEPDPKLPYDPRGGVVYRDVR
jgi:hypothetical protein